MLILEAPNLALCTSVIKRRKYTHKKLSVNAVCFKNHQSVFSHLEHFEIVFHKIMCFKNRERVGGNCPEMGGGGVLLNSTIAIWQPNCTRTLVSEIEHSFLHIYLF